MKKEKNFEDCDDFFQKVTFLKTDILIKGQLNMSW